MHEVKTARGSGPYRDGPPTAELVSVEECSEPDFGNVVRFATTRLVRVERCFVAAGRGTSLYGGELRSGVRGFTGRSAGHEHRPTGTSPVVAGNALLRKLRVTIGLCAIRARGAVQGFSAPAAGGALGCFAAGSGANRTWLGSFFQW